MVEPVEAGDTRVITRDIAVGGALAFRRGEAVTIENIDPNPRRPEFRYVVYSRSLQRRFQLSDADLAPAPQQGAFPGYGYPASPPAGIHASRRGGGKAKYMVIGAIALVAIAAVVLVLVFFVFKGSTSGPEAAVDGFIKSVFGGDAADSALFVDPDEPEVLKAFTEDPPPPGMTVSGLGYETVVDGERAEVVVVSGYFEYMGQRIDMSDYAGEALSFALENKDGEWLITGSSILDSAFERECQSNQRTIDGAVQSYQANDPEQRYPESLEDMASGDDKVLKSVPTCPVGGEYIWVTAPGNTGMPPYVSCPDGHEPY